MFQRILAIIKKETLQMLRDRVTLSIALLMPIIQIILFGFAISMNVMHIPTVVADQRKDSTSRDYLDGLVNSQYFKLLDIFPIKQRSEKLLTTIRLRSENCDSARLQHEDCQQ